MLSSVEFRWEPGLGRREGCNQAFVGSQVVPCMYGEEVEREVHYHQLGGVLAIRNHTPLSDAEPEYSGFCQERLQMHEH